ncbi:SRPBCC family protein [Thalassobacillus sp. B23F22_16]|uniref:SRPBCC family protein n=1 Tax=Thalassobacillus sp. B23F22_16 TaxID=3459513 RepID=UPI00373E0DC9
MGKRKNLAQLETMSKDSSQISAESNSEREIVTTRLFHANKEQMYKAFSNPEHLAQWWGPKGFTNTFHEFDMSVNGVWRFTMHGPNGKEYENKSVFLEVEKPERIVLRHLEPNHEFLLTITFTEQEDKTLLTWHMLFESAAECKKVSRFVPEANEQNLDRLEAQLLR